MFKFCLMLHSWYKVYSEPSRTSVMELFAEKVSDFQLLTILAKCQSVKASHHQGEKRFHKWLFLRLTRLSVRL